MRPRSPFLLFLAACSPDGGLTKFNNDPVARITSHADGDTVNEGDVTTLRGTASDTNHDADELVVRWFSNQRELCAEAVPAANGDTTCDVTLQPDEGQISLEVRDPANAVGTDRVELKIAPTDAPIANIVTPNGRFPAYTDYPVFVTATAADSEDGPEKLTLAWTNGDGDPVDLPTTPEADGSLTGTLEPLPVGTHLLTLTVTDSSGKVGVDSTEIVVNGPNSLPTCTILSPEDGSTGAVGTEIVLAGEAIDADIEEVDLIASWSSDVDGDLGETTVDEDGLTGLRTSSLSMGAHTLTFEVEDEVGATCSTQISFYVGGPPTVAITLPAPGALEGEAAMVRFAGVVEDDLTAPDLLELVWESDVDGRIDTTSADATGYATFLTDSLSPGPHQITLTATDEEGLSSAATVDLIINAAPGAPGVQVTPLIPDDADDLVAAVVSDAVDPEGDPVTYTYAWTVNGSTTPYTGTTVPASVTARGQLWEVWVTPNDGYSDGAVGTASVSVANSAPTLASVTLSPDPAYEGDLLSCAASGAADVDGDAVSTAVTWTVNGISIGVTSNTLTDSWFVSGDAVACIVTPNDGYIDGAAVTSNVVTISNTAPTASGATISPDPAVVGDALVCSIDSFYDIDGDPDLSTYTWLVNGLAVATGDTLTGGFVGGDTVTCQVTPFDGMDVGATVSTDIDVANTAPVLASVSLTPTSPLSTETLTCSPGTVSDVDGTTSFTYRYRWTVNGTALSRTAATLPPTLHSSNDTVACYVIANDGDDDSAEVASNSVTISNSAPVISAVSLSPTSPKETDTITASVTASDSDGDTISYTYAWTVNGSAIAASGATLTGASFAKGDVIAVTVTPSDAYGSGAAFASTAVTAINSAPSVTGASITPTSPTASTPLTCVSTGYADVDGDTEASTYAWQIDGVSAGSGATLSSGFGEGDVVTCTVTPGDGSTTGTARSTSVTIGGSAPVLASVALSPTTATEASTFTCTPGSVTDPDGTTSFTYTYAWYVNGALISPTSSTLSATWFGRGNTVYCQVTPADATLSGAAVASNAVTVDNTAPTLSAVSLTPTSVGTNDTLTASVSAADIDSDTISYSYVWKVNGTTVAATGSTLSGVSYFSRGDSVTVTVTPTDGTTAGSAMTSSAVTVSNSAPSATAAAISPDPARAGDALSCAISGYSDADGDANVSTYTWKVNGTTVGTGSTLSSGYKGGDTVLCTATPSDGTTSGTAVTESLTITNTAPVLASVSLTPASPSRSSTLTCTPGSITDADGTTSFSYSYSWVVNGSTVAATGSTLTNAYFSTGNTVYCAATPTDGTTAGAAVASNTVTISNSAPVMSAVTLSPSTVYTNDTLTASASATDADGDTISYTYVWKVNGSTVAATGATLSGVTYFSKGDVVSVTVTPTDGATAGTAMSSSSVTISNSTPAASSAAITPDPAYAGNTLSCALSGYSDADGDTAATTYVWKVGSTTVGTSATLSSGFTAGSVVTCTATPNDGTTAGTAVSDTITITNSAPVLSSVALTPTSASEASTLTCTPGSTTDSDGTTSFTYTYAWVVNGSAISPTTSTLTGTYFSKGATVYCTATPSDGSMAGAAVASNTVTISNTAPVMASVSLSPSTATTNDTLTASVSASDADGDTISYTYVWKVNGSTVAATGSTLSGATYFSKGDVVSLTVTPSDGSLSGTAMSATSVTISNSTPSASSAAITPNPAYAGNTLSCALSGYSDADGDTAATTYVWKVGSTTVGTSATLSSGFSVGNVVTCTATPSDGSASGTAVSDTITISNTPPVLASVSLSPTSASESSTLTCTPGSTSDADGTTSFTYTYAWYVNGSVIAPTTSTLTGTYFSKGATVYCKATPSDGTSAGTAVASNTATVSNSLPAMTSVSLSPSTVYEGNTITCAAAASDADGDTITYTYAWTVAGSSVAVTSSTLTSAFFSKGQAVVCTATPNDGTASGTAMSSSSLTVSNSAPAMSAVSLTPTSATESSTLTCSPSASDADSDTITYTYAWYKNSAVIAATSATLTGSSFSKGDVLYCRVTPSDGSLSGTAMSSSTVTISNTAPTAPVVAIDPSDPEVGEALWCAVTTAGSDVDGDSLSYTIAWKRNGSSYSSGLTTTTRTGDTVPGTATAASDVWSCTATVSDGSTTATSSASSVTVLGASYTVGYDTALGYVVTGGEQMGYIFAEPITVSTAGTLTAVGLINFNTGYNIKIGVYGPSSTLAGAPLVAEVATQTPALGAIETAITAGSVSLTAGTYYIAWQCGGANCKTQYATTGGAGVYYKSGTTFGTMSSTYPTGSTMLANYRYNFYLVMR